MQGFRLNRRAAVIGFAAAAALGTFSSASAQETVIRVERSPVGQFQGLFIAEELGYFKERGIKLEINIGASPDGALAQLMAGQKDIAMTGLVPITAAAANGMPVVAVLNAQDQNEIKTFGLMVKKDSPIQKFEDLKGKKIGLPGIASPQGTAFLTELEKHGMAQSDVELVNLPFPGVLEAIESGAVDAGMPIGLFYSLAKQQGYREFPEVYDNLVLDTPAVLFASTKQWADDNKELLTKFNEAMALAYEYANKNPDKVREVDLAQTKLPPEYIKTREVSPFVAGFNAEKWTVQNEALMKFGFISRVPDPSEFIWSGAPKQ
jgi:NitT/TauT family transport system substrate-binding protein